MSIAARESVEWQLPEGWHELSSADVESAEEYYGALADRQLLEDLRTLVDDELLPVARVATLFLPLHDDQGLVLNVLVASLLVVLVPGEVCPPVGDAIFEPALREALPIPGGGTASFLSVTVPVASAEGSQVALFNFSTPNLPVADFMITGFRAIAATARVAELNS